MTTSVATQTHWSWLKDLEEIARLTREHAEEFNLEKGGIQELQHTTSLNPHISGGIHERFDASTSESENTDPIFKTDSKCRDNQKWHAIASHKGEEANDDKANEKTLVLPLISDTVINESKDRSNIDSRHAKEALVLPPLVSVSQVEAEMDNQEDDTKSVKAVSVSSMEQLEQLTFPFFEDQTEEDTSDTEETSDTIIEDSDRGSGSPVSGPSLKLDNLPWPSILQYMRESESLASEYFSFNNRGAIESRLADNRRLQRTVTLEEAERLKKSHHIMTNDCGENDLESESTRNEKEGDSPVTKTQICDFCGQNSTQISLLRLADDQDSHVGLCCEEKKEFCVFMAVCMRQMVTRLKQQRPKKISVELTKKEVKKTAEEKALAMMRRQRKWEELRRRKDEIQQQIKLPKHTQLIQFSLQSPVIVEGEWMVRPESALNHQTPQQKLEALKREKALKKKAQEHLRKGILLPKTIERLKQCERTPHELKVRNYGDEKNFVILLPDGTGQVYYPSGNQAITIFSPYSGVLAYLVFEDSSQASLLAYIDELGRITCYNSEASIRLLLRPCEGFLYDSEGCQSCRKRWSWSSGETSVIQPFTLSLNKQLNIKLNSHEKFLLSFCGSKLNHIKFNIESKLNDDTMLSQEIESVQVAQSYLGMVKNRIGHLLQLLKQNSRPNIPRKPSVTEGTLQRSDWQRIYNTKTLVQREGNKSRTREITERRRTKSTGGLILQKSPIKIKPVI